MTTAIEVHGRRIGLGAHPVGLDVERVKSALARPEATRTHGRLRRRTQGQAHDPLGGAARLHQGHARNWRHSEAATGEYPELQGRVTLVTICVPAAREMTIYRALQTQIEQAVGRINGRYSRVGWTPVQFFFAPSLRRGGGLLRDGGRDVDHPLRDGLNLVCKEYVATQGMTEGSGVLVLSEFAGAAAELRRAILAIRLVQKDLRDKVFYATTVHRNEARTGCASSSSIVCSNDRDLRRDRRFSQTLVEITQKGAPDTPLTAISANIMHAVLRKRARAS